MSKSNPRKAVAALVPASIEIPGTGLSVRPLTLAAYAVLDKIDSPLLREGGSDAAYDLLPTLYVLCNGPAEALHGSLADKALAWADGLPPHVVPLIRDACERQVRAMLDVVPEPGPGASKKKARTDGSRPSRSGRATPTGGPSPTPSAESPRPPSC